MDKESINLHTTHNISRHLEHLYADAATSTTGATTTTVATATIGTGCVRDATTMLMVVLLLALVEVDVRRLV